MMISREVPIVTTPQIGAVLLAGAGVALSVCGVVVALNGVSIAVYFRDPAASFGFTPLAGMISHLGVFALAGSGVICIFASNFSASARGLLRAAGTFSLLIAVDDFFMLHEDILPRLGVSELVTYAIYGGFAGLIGVAFRTKLLGSAHFGLHIAIAFLAASVVYDMVAEFSQTQAVIEDSLKFIGLVMWSAYWIKRASLEIESSRQTEFGHMHAHELS
ncbi:hypothetical protein PARPLA_03348 [Rhodobacteraceae bacterium THAF1]|uniref:hypothetical protein n=1 Tax=Palleronia sp. THAF1 TaxID=2587842 RepID=UPI000F40C3A2|nr:hypothetical protein [Palleronia sp. THAF1]QFU10360.1 hypothetical protein FIU81_16885 [Palleronia sp. THAF1]VDC31479.1 hypothetical protein PARPLA_03348 [Rhodobacteraceae bacterium THAF1]